MPNYTIAVSDDLNAVLTKLAAQRKKTAEDLMANEVIAPWLKMIAQTEYRRVREGKESDWYAECKKVDSPMFK